MEEQILNLGFRHVEKVEEMEFDYEWWQLEYLGIYFDITNEYDKNGTLKKQYYSINDYNFELAHQEHFLKSLYHIKQIDKMLADAK